MPHPSPYPGPPPGPPWWDLLLGKLAGVGILAAWSVEPWFTGTPRDAELLAVGLFLIGARELLDRVRPR